MPNKLNSTEYYKLKDPHASECELCGEPRYSVFAKGDPAYLVRAYFECKHTGVWDRHNEAPGVE